MNLWTWMSGSNQISASGVYGAQGTAAASNVPGARADSTSWADSAGNLWLFGGYGYDANGTLGYLNDLWMYSPSTNQWTWVSGSSTVDAAGVYGTQGMAMLGNTPGARLTSVSSTDSAGNLWLFGGSGYDANGNQGVVNDLWVYSPSTNLWTWVGGSNTRNAPGVYGTLGIAAQGNVPGSRDFSLSWTDRAGHFWVFGGDGYDVNGNGGYLNDLWEYIQ
jgi:N-acetylneuraminic acid mutarotase